MLIVLNTNKFHHLFFIVSFLFSGFSYSANKHPSLKGMSAPYLKNFITNYSILDSSKQMMTSRRICGPISGGYIHKSVVLPSMKNPSSQRQTHTKSYLVQVGNGSVVEANVKLGYSTTIFEGVHIHENTTIGNEVEIHHNSIIGKNVTIGDHVTIGAGVYVGPDTVIAHGTKIGNHTTLNNSTKNYVCPIKIGKNNLIGRSTHLLDGVVFKDDITIGDECCIESHVFIDQRTILGSDVYIKGEKFSTNGTIGPDNNIGSKSTLHRVSTEKSVTTGYSVELGSNINIVEHSKIPDNFFWSSLENHTHESAQLKTSVLYAKKYQEDMEGNICRIQTIDSTGSEEYIRGCVISSKKDHLSRSNNPILRITPPELYQYSIKKKLRHRNLKWTYTPQINTNDFDRGHTESLDDCSICLEENTDSNNSLSFKNCSHSFHKKCVLSWLANELTCPLCRTIVYPNIAGDQNKIIEDMKSALHEEILSLLNTERDDIHEQDVPPTPRNMTVEFFSSNFSDEIHEIIHSQAFDQSIDINDVIDLLEEAGFTLGTDYETIIRVEHQTASR